MKYSGDPVDLKDRDIFIVTVPTPVNQYNRPDLTLLHLANETVGSVMKPGAIVVYESTVYPGCTEEECVPVLEGLRAVTMGAAYQYFREEQIGSIEPGKRADFVLLSHNPLEVLQEDLRDIQVAATFKDGTRIWP